MKTKEGLSMSQVWKFPLVPIGNSNIVEVDMPFYSSPISVTNQYGDIMLYALVTPPVENEPKVKRRFLVAPTGGEIPEWPEDRFIGTVTITNIYNMQYVFHIFEVD
jgi:hypothetical protein